MTSQPILSICIPTYNRAEYLDKTLSEIVNSDIFKSSNDIEIVISNNCSTDNTNEVCLTYLDQYPDKIKYINQEKPIPWERHFIKVLEYGVGKYLKLNNDTCYFEDGMLEKIVNYLKLNNDTDFLFILNKNSKDKCQTKFSNFNDLLTYISYEITWIGSFCPQKEVFYEIKDKIGHYDSLMPQVDVYGKLFLADKTVTVWEEKLLTVQDVEKKGANYNITEIFGNKYFEILYEYTNKKNGISPKTIKKEKKNIIKFINNFYFDHNNQFRFLKTGYFKFMLKNYKFEPYFYIYYLENLLKAFLGYIIFFSKNETHREYRLFNLIKIKIKRKGAKRKKQNHFQDK